MALRAIHRFTDWAVELRMLYGPKPSAFSVRLHSPYTCVRFRPFSILSSTAQSVNLCMARNAKSFDSIIDDNSCSDRAANLIAATLASIGTISLALCQAFYHLTCLTMSIPLDSWPSHIGLLTGSPFNEQKY